MWWTPIGKRTLRGAEATLFREALGFLVDQIRDDDGSIWQFDVPIFDDLQQGQKLAVLARVGKALLRPEVSVPESAAVLEGAVGVVYLHLRDAVEIEVEPPEASTSLTWRELILAACRQREIDEELPAADCEDLNQWELLIDCLMDAVLWDEDWRDEGTFLDAPPETGRQLKRFMGIDRDYYTDVPMDPKPAEFAKLLAELWSLTQG
jgi:hypothetical protein